MISIYLGLSLYALFDFVHTQFMDEFEEQFSCRIDNKILRRIPLTGCVATKHAI